MTDIQSIKAGLEGLKTNVASLKDRATKLGATREGLIRTAATLEQTQTQAVAELKDLGVVLENLDPATLEARAEADVQALNESIATLEKTITAAEALVNGNPAATLSLD